MKPDITRGEAMKERRRLLALVTIMTVVSLVVGGIAIFLLYRTALSEEKERLIETAHSQASLIEAIARFDAVQTTDYPGGVEAATISQITEAFKQFRGFHDTREFTLVKQEGDLIHFVLAQRHDELLYPQPVLFESHLAEPMRRALSGQSGLLIGLDYWGEEVLAAYEPVAVLKMGIVAKMDMAEIRAPFIRAGFIAGGAAAVVIALGSALFLQVGNPIIRQMRELQERFSGLFNSAKDAISFFNLDGVILDVNDAFSKLTGYSREELLSGIKFNDITPEEYHERENKLMDKLRATKTHVEYEKEYTRKDGSRVPVLATIFVVRGNDGRPIAQATIIKDMTETKEIQEKLMRNEKLALLGQLAGGLGHELRNPLSAIKNAAYFLNMTLKKPHPETREAIEILEKEVATSEHLISSLLGFARPRPPILSETAINDLVKETVAKAHIPRNIKVVYEIGERLPDIPADSNQLGQVFSNIILNAIQAMPEGGQLTVKSEQLDSKQVSVSFTDTGAGIPQKETAKVFEPLFTTKAKGIGLGLAVTRTIVEGHGGTITAQNTGGKGAIFTVKLPMNERKE